ncbi:glycosyltransferase family 4 protein [Skermania sp. ID1734]|nr:glycosyltransferase family 4 protein [Skermania sp. ID1734]
MTFLSHTGAPSGAELAFTRLACALAQQGYRTAAVLTAPGPLTDLLQEGGVEVTVSPVCFDSRSVTRDGSVMPIVRGAFAMLAAGWTVGGVLRETKSSVVIAESTKALLMGTIASRRARIPLVWQVHDRISREYFGWLAPLIRFLGLVVAHAFIANSQGTRRTLWTLWKPVTVAYPGVDLTTVPDPKPQRPADLVRIAMVGRLTEWKGQDLVLEALAQTRTAAEVTFIGGSHFGEEQYGARLRALTEELGLSNRVTFVGHQPRPLTAMADADIVIQYTRLTEPFGQVVVEAMAVGCAVIATDLGGPTEIVTNGVDGVLVAPNRPGELARAIDDLVADHELRLAIAARAMDRAKAFSLAASAESALAVLRSATPEIRSMVP